jgi:hypothetical protein
MTMMIRIAMNSVLIWWCIGAGAVGFIAGFVMGATILASAKLSSELSHREYDQPRIQGANDVIHQE